MSLDPRLERLRARASRALGPHRVEDAVKKVRAIIGPSNLPPTEGEAQKALDRLRDGEAPTPEQLAALEQVVRLMRPVIASSQGLLDDLPDDEARNLHPQEYKDLWSRFRTAVRPFLYSIGRIERMPKGIHAGSGFVVADGVLATNRHVLAVLTAGTDGLVPGAARVVFQQEDRTPNAPEHIVPLTGVVATHPSYDIALLALGAPTGAAVDRPPLQFAARGAAEADRVAVIGYPGQDQVNNPLFLGAVYQGRFGNKRAALGEILDGTAASFVFHDCSTTQGNSGSPVLDLESARVVGIHRAGFFMYRNEAVAGAELDAFVAAAR
jgi:S1-C subfamily serine protease